MNDVSSSCLEPQIKSEIATINVGRFGFKLNISIFFLLLSLLSRISGTTLDYRLSIIDENRKITIFKI